MLKLLQVRNILTISVLTVIVLIASCSHGIVQTKQDTNEKIYWPTLSEGKVIEYIGKINTPEDLDIYKGFWSKVVEFFTGSVDGYLVRPMAIVSDLNGVVYIADPGVKGVHRFDMNNQSYELIVRENNLPLLSPVALIIDSESNLIISDSQLSALFKVQSGEFVAKKMPITVKLMQPTGLAMGGSDNDFYVVDTLEHKIFHLTAQGNLIHQFGSRGNSDGKFNFPTMAAFKHKQLIITDTLNFRIQLFDNSGKFLSKFGQLGDATGYHVRPKGVAMDADKNIYVVDGLFHTVQMFDKNGQYLMNFGEQGHLPGQFWLPTGIYIDQQQTIYVADSHNQRVQMFRYLGVEQ